MALPLPRVVADVGPGGGLVTALGGINALNNAYQNTRYNRAKADYAPLTIPSEAYSKLAYARAVAPQFLAKLMQNPGFLGNTSEEQKNDALHRILSAGMTDNANLNALNNMPLHTGIGQPSTNNFGDKIKNAFMGLIGQNQQQSPNPLFRPPEISNFAQNKQPYREQARDGVDHALDAGYIDWMNSPEGQRETQNPEGAKVPSEEQLRDRGRQLLAGSRGNPSIEIDMQGGVHTPTYAENSGRYQGIVNEGEALGKHRANVINDLGNQQLQLSNTGATLDRLVDDINDPKFMALREKFPFYQNMQLKALSKIGDPEQQEMVGNFIADVKSFAGATVNSFKGQTMKREFDYANEIKPNEDDTVSAARGKLNALKTLKEIAERKNDIIIDLMQNKHMNIGDAVKQANKKVDTKAISEEIKKLNSPMVTLHDPKNPGITIRIPLWEARKRGVKNV